MRILLVMTALWPCAVGTATSVAIPFKAGIAAYGNILSQLTGEEIAEKLVNASAAAVRNDLKDWASRLGQKCERMSDSFQQSQAANDVLIEEQDKRLMALTSETSRLDSSIARENREIAGLQASANGKQHEVDVASANVDDAKIAFRNQQRVLWKAEEKLEEARRKCEQLWIFSGICHTIQYLTREVENDRRVVNRARDSLNREWEIYHRKVRELSNLKADLATKRAEVRRVTAERDEQRRKRDSVREELRSASQVSAQQKQSGVFLAALVVPGKTLFEAVRDAFLIDLDVLLVPVDRIAHLLTVDLQAGPMPSIPKLSAAQKRQVENNLVFFHKHMGDYPLIIS